MSLPRRSSRRSFLQGQTAIDALADALPDAESLSPNESNSPRAERANQPPGEAPSADSHRAEGYLLRIGRRAMACEFEVLLNAGQYADGAELAVEALDLVEQLEDQLTVFRAQ